MVEEGYYEEVKNDLVKEILRVIICERDYEYDNVEVSTLDVVGDNGDWPTEEELKYAIEQGQKKFDKIIPAALDEVKKIMKENEKGNY